MQVLDMMGIAGRGPAGSVGPLLPCRKATSVESGLVPDRCIRTLALLY
jgi:hypothetical protein